VWSPGSADTVCPRPPLSLTFDRLTFKLVCESHLRWGTFLPSLGMLGLLVLELFAMYATDRQTDRRTDGRTDKTLTAPFPTVGGVISGRLLILCHKWHDIFPAPNATISVWWPLGKQTAFPQIHYMDIGGVPREGKIDEGSAGRVETGWVAGLREGGTGRGGVVLKKSY